MQTTSRAVAALVLLVLGSYLVPAQRSVAQTIKPVPLRDNPYRDPGGACLYGKNGQVVYAPPGAYCPDRRDHLGRGATAESLPELRGLPSALRGEITKLFGDHRHISEDMVKLRQAIANDDQRAALEAVDDLTREITDHRAREERAFEQVSCEPAAP